MHRWTQQGLIAWLNHTTKNPLDLLGLNTPFEQNHLWYRLNSHICFCLRANIKHKSLGLFITGIESIQKYSYALYALIYHTHMISICVSSLMHTCCADLHGINHNIPCIIYQQQRRIYSQVIALLWTSVVYSHGLYMLIWQMDTNGPYNRHSFHIYPACINIPADPSLSND